MKAIRSPYIRFLCLCLLSWLIALGLALFLPSPVYADDCMWEPWNLADCLRTPGFREVYVAVLAGLGVGPAILAQILAEASKSTLTDQDVNNLIWKKVFDRIKKWLGRNAARQVGANLAANSANILNNWDKSQPQNQPPPSPPKIEPPVENIFDFTPGRVISGPGAIEYLKQTGALERVKKLHKGDDWDTKIKSMDGDPGKPTVTDFVIKWTNNNTPDLKNLVFVIPDTLPPASGPTPPDQEIELVQEELEEEEVEIEEEKKDEKGKAKGAKPSPKKEKEPEVTKTPPAETKPPDLRKLLDDARKERDAAQKLIVDLLKRKTDLVNKLVQATAEYDRTLNKAVTDGIVDIVDIATDIAKPLKMLETSTFKGAYAKDLIKSALKGLLGELATDGLQVSDLQKIKWTDAVKPTGVVLDRPMSDYFEKPDRVLDYIMPGGGVKQLIQNYMEKTGHALSNELYGPGETAVKAAQDFRDANEKSAQLRGEIGNIQKELTSVRNKIEDTNTTFEIANNSVKRNQANIDQFKAMFPHRFRNW
jgi:hypothetical protein